MALTELLRKYKTEEDEDAVRDAVRLLAHRSMELEVNEKGGAEKSERSPDRAACPRCVRVDNLRYNRYRGYSESEWMSPKPPPGGR